MACDIVVCSAAFTVRMLIVYENMNFLTICIKYFMLRRKSKLLIWKSLGKVVSEKSLPVLSSVDPLARAAYATNFYVL